MAATMVIPYGLTFHVHSNKITIQINTPEANAALQGLIR